MIGVIKEINRESEAGELLLNSDFLRLLKDFLNFCFKEDYFEYLLEDSDINNFIIKLFSSNLKSEIPFKKEDLLINIGNLFNDTRFLGFFSEYVETYNIKSETIYQFSIVGDLLLSINNEQYTCANKSTYISERLKENVGNIIDNRKIENTVFKLKQS